jgi:hypothetical protein
VRSVAPIAAAVVLAGVVAATAGDVPAWLAIGPARPARTDILLLAAGVSVIAVLAAAAFALLSRRGLRRGAAAAVAAAAAVTGRPRLASSTAARGPAPSPSLREALGRALPVAAVATTAIVLVVLARFQDVAVRATGAPTPEQSDAAPDRGGRPFGFLDDRAPPVVAGEGEAAVLPPGPPEPELFPVSLLLLLAALAVGLAAGLLWWRYRSARSSRPAAAAARQRAAGPEHDAAHGAVIDSIDAMLRDPEPRTAIIGAYARLLEGLAACGLARHDHEAPMEHLRRALSQLAVRHEPLRRLLRLFERARFSTHALTAGHRSAALAALHEIAGDLASAARAAEASAPLAAPASRSGRQASRGRH